MFWLAFLGASASLSPIADVRVGDDGMRARVEVLCTRTCDAEPLDENTFLVTWAQGDFVADVSRKSRFVTSIAVETQKYGAAVRVETRIPPRAILASKCGRARLCLDFDFSAPEPKAPPRPTMASLDADLERLMHLAGYPTAADAPKPHLAAVRTSTTMTTANASRGLAARVAVTKAPVSAPPAEVPSTGMAETRAMCLSAEKALADDAWNLGAFQTVALCRASREDDVTAESYLSRLRTYADSSVDAAARSALR